MSNENNYPKLPGQTHVEPYYVQIPQSEYESLKRENEQLHALLQGAPKQSPNAEIDTLTSEVKALREMNVMAQARITELERMDSEHTVHIAKMNGYISTLEDSQRWRKFPDEKPSEEMEGEDFIVSNGFYAVVCEWRGYWNNEPFLGDKNCDIVKYWMQAPKAPEG